VLLRKLASETVMDSSILVLNLIQFNHGFMFSGIVRVFLVAAIFLMAWYTIHLYAQLFSRLKTETPQSNVPEKGENIIVLNIRNC